MFILSKILQKLGDRGKKAKSCRSLYENRKMASFDNGKTAKSCRFWCK